MIWETVSSLKMILGSRHKTPTLNPKFYMEFRFSSALMRERAHNPIFCFIKNNLVVEIFEVLEFSIPFYFLFSGTN
jgi:hypothetical protein